MLTLDLNDPLEAGIAALVLTNRSRKAAAYPTILAPWLCHCGCGRTPRAGYSFVKGHNNVLDPEIRCYKYLELGTNSYRNTPCFLWTGPKSAAGYGQMTVRGRKVYVHRWAYKRWVGPLLDDETVDHECHNHSLCVGGAACIHRACWNPIHLDQVTLDINKARGMSPCAINTRKIMCDSGHEFTPENTYITTAGGRECRICKRRNFLAFQERRRSGQW